jgi:hypothetical protein
VYAIDASSLAPTLLYPEPKTGEGIDVATVMRTDAATLFRDAKARWDTANVREYTIRYTLDCECSDAVSNATVTVRDGVVVASSGAFPVGRTGPRQETVTGAFDRINSFFGTDPATDPMGFVRYDPETGAPVLMLGTLPDGGRYKETIRYLKVVKGSP